MITQTMTATATKTRRIHSAASIFRIFWTIISLTASQGWAAHQQQGERDLAAEDQYCCLCGGCNYPARATSFIDASGTTCQKLDSQMFNPSNYGPARSDGRCASLQNQHRNCCCNPSANCGQPAQNPRPAPPIPQNNLPMGREPPCSLCLNHKFPTKPYTITTVMYIPGNPTCQDLHFMGQANQIPGALCYPLQLYMQAPCGCN